MTTELKQLQEENDNLRADIDTIISQSRMSQKLREELLQSINLLVDNEIEQEKFCNE